MFRCATLRPRNPSSTFSGLRNVSLTYPLDTTTPCLFRISNFLPHGFRRRSFWPHLPSSRFRTCRERRQNEHFRCLRRIKAEAAPMERLRALLVQQSGEVMINSYWSRRLSSSYPSLGTSAAFPSAARSEVMFRFGNWTYPRFLSVLVQTGSVMP